jgi:Tol biopolymer transport system component/DNA-binding winged helix-turn-helix (wHTH) protein
MPSANQTVPSRRSYEFGPFRLDPAEHLLARDGQALAIPPKAFDLLTVLVARAGHLVTKEDLLKDVWPNAFVEEANLSYTISLLRKALGDDETPYQFIETVPKRGYRFVAPVGHRTPPEPAAVDAVTPVAPRGDILPRQGRRGRIAPTVVVVAGLLALVAAGTWKLERFSAVDVPPMQVVPLTTLTGKEESPTFSPEGDRVAFSWDGEEGNKFDIYVKVIGSSQAQRLTTDPARDVAPSWSPDGRSIAFVRAEDQARIHVMSSLGGPDLKLSDFAVEPGTISWSPDGRYIAAPHGFSALAGADQNTGIYIIPTQGGEPRAMTHATPPAFDQMPAFSPDGRHLAYVSCVLADSCQLFRIDVDAALAPTARPRRLTTQVADIRGLAWSRDGTFVIFGREIAPTLGYLWRVAVDGNTPPERIESAGVGARSPATARSRDRMAFIRDRDDSDVYRFEVGLPPRRWLASSLLDYGAQFSRDGRRVVFASARSGDAIEIWVAAADGSNTQQLTHGPGPFQGSPQWSPDGRQVAFDSLGPDGLWHIWTIDADGGAPRQITTGSNSQHVPSWSADGQWIYFSVNSVVGRDIWRAKAAGGPLERVTSSGSGFFARESADGRSLLYQPELGDVPLVAMPIGGGPARQLVGCVQSGAFADTVEGTYYLSCDSGSDPWVHLIERRTGKDRPLGKLEGYAPSHATSGLAVSPHDGAILYTRQASHGSDLMLIESFR